MSLPIPFLRRLPAVALLCGALTASPLFATGLEIEAPSANDDLVDILEGALDTRVVIESGTPTAQDIVAAAQADYARLVAALYDQGYYAPQVSILVDGREASGISPFETPSAVTTVRVVVDPGSQFVFGRTEVAPLPEGTAKPEALTSGQVAQLQKIKDGASAAVSSWRGIGHAKAEISEQDITADHRDATIDVTLGITPGPRVTFGNLQISGLERTRPERVREIAGLKTGTTFDPDELDRAANRLRRAGAFGVVSLTEAEQVNADQSMDIVAELSERKPRRFGFGAEYDTVEGGRVSAFWMHRNFFGGSERFRVEGSVSGIDGALDGLDYDTSVSLTRPATGHPDATMTIALGYSFTDDPGYRGDRVDAEVSFERIVSDELTATYGIGLVGERMTDAYGHREFRLATLPLGVTYDKRDDSLDPSEGYYLNSTATPFLGLAGAKSGARFSADARGYLGFGGDDRIILAGRLQLGSIVGPDTDETPPDFLFFSGGGGTVRGQPYQSLGVSHPSGALTGGRNFIGLSGEARIKAFDKIQLVGFYDTGFVGDSSLPGEDGSWHSGTGLGLRYKTSLGPIRVDVATPASGSDAYNSVSFYVGLGQSF